MKIRRLIYRSGIIAAFLPLLSDIPSRAQLAVFDTTAQARRTDRSGESSDDSFYIR